MWYTVSFAAVGRLTLEGPNRDWRPDWGNTKMPVREGWWRSQVWDRGQGELLLKEALHFQMTPVKECFNLEKGLDCIDEETGRGGAIITDFWPLMTSNDVPSLVYESMMKYSHNSSLLPWWWLIHSVETSAIFFQSQSWYQRTLFIPF